MQVGPGEMVTETVTDVHSGDGEITIIEDEDSVKDDTAMDELEMAMPANLHFEAKVTA